MAKMTLAEAVLAGDEKMVAKLLPTSTSAIHRQDGMGFTPLHWAADQGLDKIAGLLLGAGASPDIQDMDGLTPLHFASLKGHLECARLMIPLADIDILDFKDERTALGHALFSVLTASRGFMPERGAPAQMIADLLANEPGRRVAAEQAAILEASTLAGVAAPASKPRI